MPTLLLLLGLLAVAVDLMPTLALLLGLLAMVVDLMVTLVFLLGLLTMVLDLMLTFAFLLGFLGLLGLLGPDTSRADSLGNVVTFAEICPMRRMSRLGCVLNQNVVGLAPVLAVVAVTSLCRDLVVQDLVSSRNVWTPLLADHDSLLHARILSLLWTQLQAGHV